MQIAIALLLIVQLFYAPSITAPKRLLILGNSIVLSPPDAAFDWWGYWGMAASDTQHDFAHVLAHDLSAFYGPIDLRIRFVKPFEARPDKFSLEQYRDEISYRADVVVVRMGDNVPNDATIRKAVYTNLDTLLTALLPPDAILICTSSWYPNTEANTAQREVCTKHGGRWVDIGDMMSETRLLASSERTYTDYGVGTHPGDAGHLEIARRIYRAIVVTRLHYPFVAR